MPKMEQNNDSCLPTMSQIKQKSWHYKQQAARAVVSLLE